MKKSTVKLNESQLRKIVAESVKKVLKEYTSNPISERTPNPVPKRKEPAFSRVACYNYLENNGYSKESIIKVAKYMFKNNCWALPDGPNSKLLEIATDENDNLIYSFKQGEWEYAD